MITEAFDNQSPAISLKIKMDSIIRRGRHR